MIARLIVTSTCLMMAGTLLTRAGSNESCKGKDCRGNLEASVFTGLAIDTFAAQELQHYINPDDSSGIQQRAMGGFLIQYRLTGDPDRVLDPGKKPDHQLWLYARTIHGVRSADVDCSATPDLAVCRDTFNPATAPEQNLYILRNSTSLEAYLGLRYEFRNLQWGKDSTSALYVKGQLGFLSVADSGGDVSDNHVVGLGIMAVNGPRMGSRIEIGYGVSDLFEVHSNRRLKVDGLLLFQGLDVGSAKVTIFRPFAQMTVDADAGHGADSIQVYLGVAFDFNNWSN